MNEDNYTDSFFQDDPPLTECGLSAEDLNCFEDEPEDDMLHNSGDQVSTDTKENDETEQSYVLLKDRPVRLRKKRRPGSKQDKKNKRISGAETSDDRQKNVSNEDEPDRQNNSSLKDEPDRQERKYRSLFYMMTVLVVLLFFLLIITRITERIRLKKESYYAVLIEKTEAYEKKNGTAEGPVTVDLIHANVFELMQLNGVGEKRAKDIIAYREEYGPFTCAEDLLNITGIGEKTLESIRDQLVFTFDRPSADESTDGSQTALSDRAENETETGALIDDTSR